jgi:anti-sigma regulatory factor (Ser/Thr protein kinase)
MRIEISNKLEELANVIAALEEFSESAALNIGIATAAELALDELLNNIISYGYLDSDSHVITVEISVVNQTLQLVISDDGIPFNPFEQQTPDLESSIEERELGGVGIHLVKNVMDECSYQRLKERNVVTLVKKLGASK